MREILVQFPHICLGQEKVGKTDVKTLFIASVKQPNINTSGAFTRGSMVTRDILVQFSLSS